MLIFTGPLLTFKLAVVYTMDLHVCSGLKLELEVVASNSNLSKKSKLNVVASNSNSSKKLKLKLVLKNVQDRPYFSLSHHRLIKLHNYFYMPFQSNTLNSKHLTF